MSILEILSIGTSYTEGGLVITGIIAIIMFLVAKISIKIIKKIFAKMSENKGKEVLTSYYFIMKIIEIVIYFLCIYFVLIQFKALRSIGNVLLGTSSVFAAAIALASQESISNIVGGFFLSFAQPFKVEDLVNLPEYNIAGRVEDISLRHTVIRTKENTSITVPNSIMNKAVIENRDSDDLYNNFLFVGIGYDSDIDLAMQLMKEIIGSHELVEENDGNKVNVVVFDFLDSAIQLRANFCTKDATLGFSACCDCRLAILKAFQENGIDIPYPIRTIIPK